MFDWVNSVGKKGLKTSLFILKNKCTLIDVLVII